MRRLEFTPPRWLRNPHLQSILPSAGVRRRDVLARAAPLLRASRERIVDCGDGVRLHGWYAEPPARHGRDELVVLLHVWEGSDESLYVLSSAHLLHEQGYHVFRLNLRDHGPSHHLNPELFHSCRIAEVVGAVGAVHREFGDLRLTLVGYSLGGNFALRVAVRAPGAGIRLAQAIAICPVLDPARTLQALEHGFWLYRNYFVLKWRRSLLKKHRAWPDLYDLDELRARRDLVGMTDHLIRRYSEYSDLQTYLRGYAIVDDVLAPLAVPARIVHALDDPIIPAADLARLAPSARLHVAVTEYGGHCGFLERLRGDSWIDRHVLAAVREGPPASPASAALSRARGA
ncbi:MAG: YheT family hydrolase [Pseudomonadota bacterium]